MNTKIPTSEDSLRGSPGSSLVDNLESEFGYQLWCQIKTIVAVSGGPDSVALLRGLLCLAQRNGENRPSNLIVAHVNHGLRGSESDDDAKFVEALAKKLGLQFVLANSIAIDPTPNLAADTIDTNRDASCTAPSEEKLRDFRYDNLLATATKIGARYVVTGHNLNDQIETILFRIFRGTGIAGLTGIPQVRLGNDSVTIVRPMLKTRRSEIEAFLADINQDFRVDSSNSSSHYQRNYLRNELIPMIESRFGPGTQRALIRLSRQASQANQFIDSQSERLGNSVTNSSQDSIELDCAILRSEPPILVRQFLVGIWNKQNWPRQAMGFDWWERICSAIGAEASGDQANQTLNLPGGIRFSRKGNLATFLKERN